MTAPAAYTPLESLFLFQSLAAFGPDPAAFSRISDLLKNNPLIRESKSYDSGRLNPDALKELYQSLLKEETKDQSSQNAEPSTESKKRKLSSPPLPPVRDAVQHTKLLPHLVDRLYARYKDSATREIREEERKFQILEQEIREIEQGLLDATVNRQSASIDSSLPATPAVQEEVGLATKPVHAAKAGPQEAQPKAQRAPANALQVTEDSRIGTPSGHQGDRGGQAPATPQAGERASASPIIPKQQVASQPVSEAPLADASRRNNLLPASAPHGTVQGAPEAQSKAQAGPSFPRPQAPQRPPSQQMGPGYRVPSPLASQMASTPQSRPVPLAPQPQTQYPASPATTATHLPVPSNLRPTSPAIIQPSPGVGRGAVSPALTSNENLSQQQQFRPPVPHPSTPHQAPFSPPTTFQPTQGVAAPNGMHSPAQLHTPQVASQRNIHPSTAYPYPSYQQTHPPLRPSQSQQHPQPYYQPGQGGVILPPFPATPYQPIESKKANSRQPSQQPPRPNTSLAFPTTPDPSRPLVAAQVPPRISNSVPPHLPETLPVQTPPATTGGLNGRPHPPALSLDTSTSSTRWKNVDQQSGSQGQTSPIRPRPESVSPISDRGASPADSLASLPKKTPKGRRGRPRREAATKTEMPEEKKDALPADQTERTTRVEKDQKMTSVRGRRTRGRSTSSSAVTRARTRSQSVMSHADELSMDNGAVSARKIKREQPPTPASFAAEEDTDMAEATADEGMRRRRQGTSRGSEQLEPTRVAKRKRSHLSSPETADELRDQFMPSQRPHHVLSTRNFARTSSTIMNDITAHKHASMFAGPVKEKDAPGYKELILRPQDLKSIKTAIAAGARAVTAVASQGDAENAGSPAQGASTPSKNANLWVPVTPDVVPPRGIINSAQLEKELMRMFANAVMYNPDPDRGFGPAFEADGLDDNDEGVASMQEDEGRVVKDTREMYETVERSVAEWRSAERAVEEMDNKPPAVKSRSVAGLHERDDEADELAGDDAADEKGEEDLSSTVKKRRKL